MPGHWLQALVCIQQDRLEQRCLTGVYTDVFTGRQKLAFARRLGDNWQDLADYFDIATDHDGLAGRILRDTGSDPGALALLAFALAELYEAFQPGTTLTR